MQKLIRGIGSVEGLAVVVGSREKVLVIAGRHALKEEWFERFTLSVKREIKIIHPPDALLQLDGIPSIDNPDVMIAIGGGKAIDFAKAILEKAAQPEPILFIAVPTTAGSGSEATPFAVLYEGKEKKTIESPVLLPAIVFLDGALIQNLPLTQKAFSGADAFSQCIESLWNVHRTKISEKFALQGIEILFRSLPEFVTSDDEQLNQQMLEGAHLSGKAIGITRTTGAHALSYYLTSHHGVPHGQAVALFLPLFFLYNEVAINPSIYKALNVENAQEAFNATTAFFKRLGMATNFAELSLRGININSLLQSVNHQRFSNNPVPFNEETLHSLIQQHLL